MHRKMLSILFPVHLQSSVRHNLVPIIEVSFDFVSGQLFRLQKESFSQSIQSNPSNTNLID